ncbi:MAG: vWA domain-containing protein [Bradymonadales bacterium]|jgi:hypothetical protein
MKRFVFLLVAIFAFCFSSTVFAQNGETSRQLVPESELICLKPPAICAKDKVDIVYIMDKSGSMSGLEKDVVGAYNSFIKEHLEIKEKKIKISTIFFDHGYEAVFVNEDLDNARLRDGQYRPSGMTALLDAFGRAIATQDLRLKNLPQEARPCKVIFVIATDGEENSSREYSAREIHRLVSARQELGWEFLFFGANIDAFAVGQNYGIRRDNIEEFKATGGGVRNMAPRAAAKTKAIIEK